MSILRKIKRREIQKLKGEVLFLCIWPHREHHYFATYDEIRELATRLIQVIKEEEKIGRS